MVLLTLEGKQACQRHFLHLFLHSSCLAPLPALEHTKRYSRRSWTNAHEMKLPYIPAAHTNSFTNVIPNLVLPVKRVTGELWTDAAYLAKEMLVINDFWGIYLVPFTATNLNAASVDVEAQ